MRKLFQLWLFVVVSIAFLLALSLSYRLQGIMAMDSNRLMLQQKLNDALKLYERRQHNLQVIREITNDAALAKIHSLDLIIQNNPDIIGHKDDFDRLRKTLNVDEIHVTDQKGIIIASSPCNYVGYDMNSHPQSRQFMPALKDRAFELIQPPMANGFERRIVQYVGIARKDRPGIMQIGFTPQRLVEAERLAELGQIESVVKIGKEGKLQITRQVGQKDSKQAGIAYQDLVDGTPSLCMARLVDDFKIVASIPVEEIFEQRMNILYSLVFFNLLLFGIIFVVISFLLERVVIQGIFSINHSLKKITDGNLEETVHVDKTEEFRALSLGINAMVNALKASIQAEARRIDTELEAGKTIQRAMLPTEFPNTPGNQIFASMEAAREVGGDFYDIVPIDDTHEALIIADVSGKGLTAALTMMTSKALIKNLMTEGMSPAQAIAQANRELYEHNPSKMFITVFLAVYNLQTQELVCVNAGHNPPLIRHGNNNWEYLAIRHSVAIGVSLKARYTEVTVPLHPSDRLFLYTDGVTEAQNRRGELYGGTRLLNFLNIHNQQLETPRQLALEIRRQLTLHADGEPQSDDITMLALFA